MMCFYFGQNKMTDIQPLNLCNKMNKLNLPQTGKWLKISV